MTHSFFTQLPNITSWNISLHTFFFREWPVNGTWAPLTVQDLLLLFKANHLLQYSCVVWVWPWFFPAVSSSIPLLWLLYNFGLGYSYDCESTVERKHVRCYDCVYHFLYGCSVPFTESCLSVFYKMFIYYPQLTKTFCTPSGINKCIEQPPRHFLPLQCSLPGLTDISQTSQQDHPGISRCLPLVSDP